MNNITFRDCCVLCFIFAIGFPVALFMFSLDEFRGMLKEILLCMKKQNVNYCEKEDKVFSDVVLLVNVKKEELSKVILASGVSEKGREMYRMYEERFGRKN